MHSCSHCLRHRYSPPPPAFWLIYEGAIGRAGHSLIFLRFAIRSHSIFSHGSLTLMRSFFEFPFSLVAERKMDKFNPPPPLFYNHLACRDSIPSLDHLTQMSPDPKHRNIPGS